jgi:hypothetical protein
MLTNGNANGVALKEYAARDVRRPEARALLVDPRVARLRAFLVGGWMRQLRWPSWQFHGGSGVRALAIANKASLLHFLQPSAGLSWGCGNAVEARSGGG